MGRIMGRHQHARFWITACGLFFFFCLIGATPAPEVQFTDVTQTVKIDVCAFHGGNTGSNPVGDASFEPTTSSHSLQNS
jgi:hypothetical protein